MAIEEDAARAHRLKRRCEMRRNGYVNKIRSVYDLAVQCATDETLVPQLFVLVETLDQLLTSFNMEDEALLEQLVNMDLDAEYPEQESVEMLKYVSFVKATANRFMNEHSDQTMMSVHGGSRASLNNANVNAPLDDQVIFDNVPVMNSPRDVQSHNIGSLRSSGAQVIQPTRLPEIPLPTYHGDIYKWASFRDRFEAMVDHRTTLPDIEKFYNLVGCCKDDALDAIRGIPVSDRNYKLAWSTLKERFDKPRLVAYSLINKLLNAPRATSETLVELNKILAVFDEGVSILESMQIPNLGDFILFSLVSQCLPTYSMKLFEAQLVNGFPTVHELLTFVKSRVAVLECIPREPTSKQANGHNFKRGGSYNLKKMPLHTSMVTSSHPVQAAQSCRCCKGAHALNSCSKFKSWTQEVRNNWARDQRICFRCLSKGHWVSNCKSSIVCGHCSRKHHSLLHPVRSIGRSSAEGVSNEVQAEAATASSLLGQNTSPSVILGTALIHMADSAGVLHTMRALIDSASQISAVTVECKNRLGLRMKNWTVPVSGLGGVPVENVLGIVQCQAQPRFAPDPVFNFDAWVFPSITADMPRHSLSSSIADKYQHLALADPTFINPGTIDVLLGADLFAQILNGKRVSVGDGFPVAFGTVFGWTVIGAVPDSKSNISMSGLTSLTTSVETLLEKFWALEEPDAAPEEFTEEGQCEVIFREGCTRDTSGRFCVPLLFRQTISDNSFRGSRAVAEKRFEYLERKLSKDPRLHQLYCDFMAEYLALGHMSPATDIGRYFIPHHVVYRPADIDPKIRVVFDASATAYSGMSLNDCLYPGPKLQRDVVDVLLLYRVHRFVFTTDISKMYRQVSVSKEHRRYQHILWRESPNQELTAYELNTVTYGVNCAPYLALRVLKCIAEQECSEFPSVKEALLYHTYVDDICVGGDTLGEVMSIRDGLIRVLRRSGMELKKWASNTPAVLAQVPSEDRSGEPLSFDAESCTGTKVLGLQWSHQEDAFMYTFQSEPHVSTKRGMLSLIARMFDPLGFLSPVIFLAKALMQQVWKEGLSWDDPLPQHIAEPWHRFVIDLPNIQQVRIPRHLSTSRGLHCSICGFCDASTLGYAAVVYIRVTDTSGGTIVSLLGARTKLAPLKPLTVPRLELCAALLLARWLSRLTVTLNMKLNVTDVHAWSDSSTVLSWLRCSHEAFKIFVSNRIFKIQSLLPNCRWHYIESALNPADCCSRGLMPSDYAKHDLFFNGPPCLYLPPQHWEDEIPDVVADQLPEVKVAPVVLVTTNTQYEWFRRFSSYTRLIRVAVLLRRFIFKSRGRTCASNSLPQNESTASLYAIVIHAQKLSFSDLKMELEGGRRVSSKLYARLAPFIDPLGLIRVGGRIKHASLDTNQKHPLLLSSQSHLALLLFRYWHIVGCHSGPKFMMNMVARQFWIISARKVARRVIKECVNCVRFAAVHPQPIMAHLPAARVVPSRPFSKVGVDYAGAFSMKEHRLRKGREYKVYISVFICMCTKAVHLEVVSDLSTAAFLAALDRFTSRRGLPSHIYSDCGTNFVGADKLLRKFVNSPENRSHWTAAVPCQWSFNPPSAPHFGGLWEAAVKSMKSLMFRTMGPHIFTYEEFVTLVTRIEAVLNSRPLTPMSDDPNDMESLTPGHFLVGQPLLAPPEEEVSEDRKSLKQRWSLLKQSHQSFWKRWSVEYLNSLQVRNRWIRGDNNISLGDMVIIKEDNVPPLRWHLGRVDKLFPGDDGVVRVVQVRTTNGIIKRPVVKLVPLIQEA